MNSHPGEQLTWNNKLISGEQQEKTRNDLPKVTQSVADSELKLRSVTFNPVPRLLHQMAKITWHQQNLNKYCKKSRATNVYYCFPNSLKLSYKVESTQSKNLCECWQYYKNFWKFSQSPSSFKYFEANYQQSVECHLSISATSPEPRWIVLFYYTMEGCHGYLVLKDKFESLNWHRRVQFQQMNKLSNFNKHLSSVKNSMPTPSKSLYQKIKTLIFFLSGAFIFYAPREIIIERFIQKNHIFLNTC